MSNNCPSRPDATEPTFGPAEPSDDPDIPHANSGDSGIGLSIHLDLQVADVTPPLAGWLEVQLSRVAAVAEVSGGHLNVLAVDDSAMTQWHERYTPQPGTTDVLTFDLRDDPGDALEGDLVICLDEAARQAGERGHDVRLEALLYSVHGLLHLLGEEDHDPAAYERMHRREDKLLAEIGLDPVFFRSEQAR